MSVSKKLVIAVVLCAGLAVFSFGETMYGLAAGYYRNSSQFTEENFGRELTGLNINFSFHHFPGKMPLGFFSQTTFGTFNSGYEWSGDQNMRSMDSESISDVRICFAPSFKFQLGPKVRIPVSLGPAFSMYWEKGWQRDGRNTFYEAFNLGILSDVSFIFNPSRWFFFRPGLSVGWDFLHSERGEMNAYYRTVRHNRPEREPYSAISLSLYLGIGIRLE
ncbi:MAG: hypothetical protein LBG95_07550 [Treponema sp.]|nr:hypothetical protein [Treponema sp.]